MMRTIWIGMVCVVASGGTIVYDSVPGPLPGNIPSLGYQATRTSEFGGLIELAGTGRELERATVVMSNWAVESTYQPVGTTEGFAVPLTLTFYEVGPGNTVGAAIARTMVTAVIPWRPEAMEGCGSGWRAGDGNCYSGMATTVEFGFGLETLPERVIYGLSFNTQSAGAAPTGVTGPYNSLNFGLSTAGARVGADPAPGTVYWNTSNAGFYADGGAGGVGVFRLDSNWAPYTGAISVEVAGVPEVSSWGLVGAGLAGLMWRRRSVVRRGGEIS